MVRMDCEKLPYICGYAQFFYTKNYGSQKSQSFDFQPLFEIFWEKYPSNSENLAWIKKGGREKFLCVSVYAQFIKKCMAFWEVKIFCLFFKNFWFFSQITLQNLDFWVQSKNCLCFRQKNMTIRKVKLLIFWMFFLWKLLTSSITIAPNLISKVE